MVNGANIEVDSHFLDLHEAEHKIGDRDAMHDMLRMLSDLLDSEAPLIDTSLLSGDLAAAASSLHSLKGCLPIFCREDICQAVAAAESAAKSGLLPEASPAIAQLRPALAQLSAEIHAYLAQLPRPVVS